MEQLNLHQEIIFKGVKNTVTTINGDGTIRLTEYDSGREHGCYYQSELVEEVDYKELLKRYVEHVGLCEGSEFLHTFPDSELTNEDIEQIKNLFE